mmetsp:Transcript_35047/g.64908  ORF Transcript_35047/g.64908 Transcript_35047/m.64908 type:complete len:351 (-) Transcript_35047:260-1312(-)
MAASARPWVEPRRRGRGRNRRTMHIDEPEQERELNLEGFTTGDANALLRSNPDLVQYCRRLWGCKKERWPPACHWPLLLGRILEACVTNKPWPLSAVESGGVPWRTVLAMKRAEKEQKSRDKGAEGKLLYVNQKRVVGSPEHHGLIKEVCAATEDASAKKDKSKRVQPSVGGAVAESDDDDDDDDGSWVLMEDAEENDVDASGDLMDEWVVMSVASDSEDETSDNGNGKEEAEQVLEAVKGAPSKEGEEDPARGTNGDVKGILDRMYSHPVFPVFSSFLGPRELASLGVCFRGSGGRAIGNPIWQQAYRRDFFANAKVRRRKRGKKGKKKEVSSDYWKQRYRAMMTSQVR